MAGSAPGRQGLRAVRKAISAGFNGRAAWKYKCPLSAKNGGAYHQDDFRDESTCSWPLWDEWSRLQQAGELINQGVHQPLAVQAGVLNMVADFNAFGKMRCASCGGFAHVWKFCPTREALRDHFA